MTKEELIQEAEEYGIDNYEECMYDDVKGWVTDCKARVQAYIDGAEPREKRIAELEKENAELKSLNKEITDDCHKLVNALENWQNENVELEKENAELKEEKDDLLTEKNMLESQIEEEKEYLSGLNIQKMIIKKNLTKAKGIIKKIEKFFYGGENALKRLSKISDILAEAEQFLKE